jgi:hypothetical protein
MEAGMLQPFFFTAVSKTPLHPVTYFTLQLCEKNLKLVKYL